MKFPFLASIFLMVASWHCFAQNISVYPTALNFSLVPGTTETKKVTVTNISDEELFVELTLGDWLRNEEGGHQYFQSGTLENSLGKFVRLKKNVSSIAPGNSVDLEVTLVLPEGKFLDEKMLWSMLFVSAIQPLKENEGKKNDQLSAVIREVFRFGIHIYQTPPTLVEKKALIQNLEKTQEGFALKIENTGKVMLACESYLEYIHLETGKKVKTKTIEYPVFPNGIRNVLFDFPENLEPGQYSVLGVLDFDESMPLEAVEMIIDWRDKAKDSESN